MEERRVFIEDVLQNRRPVGSHMRGTLELLQALLRGEETYEKELSYFAMINAAKCSGAGKSTRMVPRRLYDRCRKYALGELRILDPEIVVTQGDLAQSVLKRGGGEHSLVSIASDKLTELMGSLGSSLKDSDALRIIADKHLRLFSFASSLSDPVIVLQTPHPSARGGKWQEFGLLSLPLLSTMSLRAVELWRL